MIDVATVHTEERRIMAQIAQMSSPYNPTFISPVCPVCPPALLDFQVDQYSRRLTLVPG